MVIVRRVRIGFPPEFADPGVGRVLRAPITPDREPAGDVLPEPAEGVLDALAQWLQGGSAVAGLGRVPADDLVRAVIHHIEEPAPTVEGL